ncbi:hypothetical protein chiPu_0032270, partial [Chiloscyllium punctatum]|nr:hypothetical protein [Chiloscyllium punctatum]
MLQLPRGCAPAWQRTSGGAGAFEKAEEGAEPFLMMAAAAAAAAAGLPVKTEQAGQCVRAGGWEINRADGRLSQRLML